MTDNGNVTWKTTHVRLGDLVRNEHNPRQMTKAAALKLQGGIKKFGYSQLIEVDPHYGVLDGNHRNELMLLMDEFGPDVPIEVRIASRPFTEKELQEYMILKHETAVGEWDLERMLDQFEAVDLLEWGVDEERLEELGFVWEEIDQIDQEETDKDKDLDQEGLDEEAQEKWGVQSGDRWQIGDSLVVLCGDCRERLAWERCAKALNVPTFNGVITSPPYAKQREVGYGGIGGYDGPEEEEYVDWWQMVSDNAMTFLENDGGFFVNIKPHAENGQRVLYVFDLVLAMVRDWGWKFIDEFCWERITAPGSWPNRFKNGFEPVYHFAPSTQIRFRPDNVRGEQPGFFERHAVNMNTGGYYNTDNTAFAWDGALPSNRLPIKENAARVGHQAAFTWKLPLFFLQAFSDEGDAWIDPFAGSASTLVAAFQSNRRAAGIEIKESSAALAIERLAKLTGIEPKKI